jgi:hypothetical protein
MRLQVVHVPDCPGAAELTARLGLLLSGSGSARIEQQVVNDLDQAAALRMIGSPTLLIDGIDPFAPAGQPPSLSCRLYRDENGTLSGSPSLAQLREALAMKGPGNA